MKVYPWKKRTSEYIFTNEFMKIEKTVHYCDELKKENVFYRMHYPEWVNVVALTPEKKIILVNQFRHGTMEFSTEIPGGIMETGENPEDGAKRELREETGYTSGNWVKLGKVAPNSAIQTNYCNVFMALDCVKTSETDFDEDEDIETFTVDYRKLLELITEGEITNSVVLSALTIFLARMELEKA